ncbi:hypothetical protein D3C77_385850 [compost metagenome]
MLVLLVTGAAGIGDVVFVAVAAHPQARLPAVEAQFAHAAAQRGRLAIPDRSCGVEQGHYRASGWADSARLRVEVPVAAAGFIACRRQLVRPGAHRYGLAIVQAETGIAGRGADHVQLLWGDRVYAGVADQQLMIAGGGLGDIQHIVLIGAEVDIHRKHAGTAQVGDIQGIEVVIRAHVDPPAVHRQAAESGIFAHAVA